MVKIHTLFQTKKAQKPYTLAPHIPKYIAYVMEYPPPHPGVQYKFLVWNKTAEFCMLSGKLFHSSQSATAHFSSNKVLATAI